MWECHFFKGSLRIVGSLVGAILLYFKYIFYNNAKFCVDIKRIEASFF